jgi:hypothetical protein
LIFRPLLAALAIVASAAATTTAMAGSAATPPASAGSMGSGIVLPHALQGAPLASSLDAIGPHPQVRPRVWHDDLPTDPFAVAPTTGGVPTELPSSGDAQVLAATDATIFKTTQVVGAPRNFMADVLEPGIATNGSTVLVTFNWYAALSTDFGATFRYISPFSNFPDSGSSFCCDQHVIYEPTRNLFIWVLQYGATDPGFERLAVATPTNAGLNKWTLYDFRASALPGISATWMVDYPQISASANFLYLSMAVGPLGSPGPSNTGIIRIPLDQLAQGIPAVTTSTFVSQFGNALTPVQRATTTMYFGQNLSSTQLNLYAWPESGSVATTAIPRSQTNNVRGSSCLTPDGKNVCGRIDSRVGSAWLGGGVIGFAWTAGADGTHPFPFIQAIRINEAARFIVDEPSIFSTAVAYLYPAISLNARGDLGVIVTAVSTVRYPSIVAFMRDDVSGPTQWTPLPIKNGNGSPRGNEWGDFQTTIPASTTGNSWIGMSWTIQATGVEPLFVSFGRERDAPTAGPSASPSVSPSPSAPITPTPSPSQTPPLPGANTPTTVYLPNVTKMLGGADGWQTPFIVQNVGTVSTDLTMSFYAFADGTLVKTRTVAGLRPGTSVFHDPNSDTDLAPGGQFSVVIKSSSAAIVAVVNEHQNVTSPTRQEALSYDGLSGGSTAVFLPYITKNTGGWLTTVIIQNLGTATGTVNVKLVPSSGASVALTRTIDAGRSQFIDPTVEPTIAAGIEYGATLTSTQPIAVVVNSHNDAATVVAPRGFSYNAVTATSLEDTWLPYVARNSDGIGRSSRVFVLNAGAATATPKLLFRRHGDNQTAAVQASGTAIAPGAVWVFDASAGSTLTDGDWSADISGGKFAVVGAALSPATAMGVSASSAFAEKLFLPNITRTLGGANGWTTPLVIESTGAPYFTVKWYRFADGTLVSTQRFADLLPIEAIRIDPRSNAALTDDTQYAVVVESASGGVAASVLELNLGGGDAAMGYDGFGAPPSSPYGTNGCDPQTAPSGIAFHCVFYGLPVGVQPTVTLNIPGRSPTTVTNTEAVAADGSWTLIQSATAEGTWSVSVAAGAVTKTVQFLVTPATFSVTLVSSSYGSVSVRTSVAGVVCQPLIMLPTGSATTGFFLAQKTSDATGTLSWTYTTPVSGAVQGQGTNLVRCYVGNEEHDARGTFQAF